MDLKHIFFYFLLFTFAPACKHGHKEDSPLIKEARVIQKDALKMYDEVMATVESMSDTMMRNNFKLQLDEWKKGMVELPHNCHEHGHDHDHHHHHHYESNLTDQQLLDGQKSWKEALVGIKNSISESANK